MGDERLDAIVRGRVQGVGFRDFVYDRARSLGLTGYVRNDRHDHRAVEVVAEGARDALDLLVERLWIGPRGASVERVDVRWRPATGEFSDFGVRW